MELIMYSLGSAFFFVFPFFIMSLNSKAKSTNEQRENALWKVHKEGHVVRATLKKTYGNVDDPYSHSAMGLTNKGVYQYEYKGKKYRYRYYLNGNLPSTITLYFMKNPRKATTSVMDAVDKTNWLSVYLIVAAVLYVVFWFYTNYML